jgi:hypothetical protein
MFSRRIALAGVSAAAVLSFAVAGAGTAFADDDAPLAYAPAVVQSQSQAVTDVHYGWMGDDDHGNTSVGSIVGDEDGYGNVNVGSIVGDQDSNGNMNVGSITG